jgi:hypothetical protein
MTDTEVQIITLHMEVMETIITLLRITSFLQIMVVITGAETSLTTALITMALRTLLIIIIATTIHPVATIFSKTITALTGTPITVAPITFFQTTITILLITIIIRQAIRSIETTITRTHPIIFSVTIIPAIIMGQIITLDHQTTFLTIIAITIIHHLVTISSIETTIQIQVIFSATIIQEITTREILL